MKKNKATSLVTTLKNLLLNITKEVLRTIHKSLVRPNSNYANQTWNPFNKNCKIFLENIQRRANRLILQLSGLGYSNRLKILILSTLEFKLRDGGMIKVLRNVKGLYDPAVVEIIFHVNERDSLGDPGKFKRKGSKTALRKFSLT